MTFENIGLSQELLRAVAQQGYDQPTAIQAQAIPAVLGGGDVMASAQTGTGKTAAFTLPLLQRLSDTAPQQGQRRIRALVLTPTRELAAQVSESVATYGRHLPLRSTEIYGGAPMGKQTAALRRGVDIVVATPGRLIDHLDRGNVDLRHVDMLILDEADRMLDMGFKPAIERILKSVPNQRQTLLFSATFSGAVGGLARRFLNEPTVIEAGTANAAAEAVEQGAYFVDAGRKRELLTQLINDGDWRQVLVFTRTKRGADRLAEQLEREGIRSQSIHGDKSQGQRGRALAAFKRKSVRALVATDVAARGLDIAGLPHVVNYDLPNNPEDYIHRIGRTGRGGDSGEAWSLVGGEERGQFKAIQRLVKREIPAQIAQGFEPVRRGGSAPTRRNNPRRGQGGRPGRAA
ncbi:DEAD/DEAH box helicase [Halorhodospira halophila]|uniref:DEAD-box ATP-dependent RNA helicase RhpA n=1 Tax=Halorhodospira halophila (strain DSM 244 / SL1) TaxID=349124 RepID=A1WVI8_HALHL|nr:DEAD/DEAH box helicase [Halorhodospira halophila]ABM61700.1 DEAD/DEAH box helicase domain protein [Halorhodospira halophila SL1]MBK1728969.1 ATP-dependent RNA helicase RhlE [Halorhodospira halophila]